MKRQAYPSDLNDEEWQRLQAALPKAKQGRTGRSRKYALREIWNAIFYQARTGCQWRYLPHDLPPWESVWEYFDRCQEGGIIQAAHDALREKVRVRAGKAPKPTAAIIDSQSVRTTQKGGTTAMMPARRSRDASDISL